MTTVLDRHPQTAEERCEILAAHLDLLRTEARCTREQCAILRHAVVMARDLAMIEVADGSIAWEMALQALDRALRLTA